MPKVKMTAHLYRYFPELEGRDIVVATGSVANVLEELNKLAPGYSDYILDNSGALRRHVNLSINNQILIDRKSLSDQVPEDATVYIFQALTGG